MSSGRKSKGSPTSWMPLYIGDYLKDTAHLSLEEHGAYLKLLMHYWTRGSLPIQSNKRATIVGALLSEWENISVTLEEFFEISEDGRWINNRLEDEREAAFATYEKTREARSAAGKRSAEVKKKRAADEARVTEEQSAPQEDNKAPTIVATNAQQNGNQPQPQPQPHTSSSISIAPSSEDASKTKKRSSPRTRLPEDWEFPDDREDPKGWLATAIKNGVPPEEVPRQAQKFKDHHHSQGNRMANWKAAWSKWTGNYIDFNSKGNGNGAGSYNNQQNSERPSASESRRTHLKAIYESSSPGSGDQLADEDRNLLQY